VLNRLGTAVEQGASLLEPSRGELVELFGDRHILLIGGDHEAGVGEVGDLPLDGLDDLVVAVADGADRDAGAEVDEVVAVDIEEYAALALDDVGRQTRADSGGDRGALASSELG